MTAIYTISVHNNKAIDFPAFFNSDDKAWEIYHPSDVKEPLFRYGRDCRLVDAKTGKALPARVVKTQLAKGL